VRKRSHVLETNGGSDITSPSFAADYGPPWHRKPGLYLCNEVNKYYYVECVQMLFLRREVSKMLVVWHGIQDGQYKGIAHAANVR
jgi:hypothetical protein